MNNIIKIFVGVLLVTFMFSTNCCTYKNAQDVYPVDTSNCNTANMSYSNNIVPILRANHCYTCHGVDSNSNGQGIVLEGYANMVKNGVPGDIIYGNVSPTSDGQISHMPQGYPDLSPCEVAEIKAWLDQGYKDN